MTAKWTVKTILGWAEEDFRSRNLPSPRLEAELLLSDVLRCSRIQLYTGYDRPVDPSERERFKSSVVRRRRGEPTAYILGKREFWSLDFKVTPDVLIPRPETETLVQAALDLLGESDMSLLDLCTGSGCVAVSIGSQKPRVQITASDISRNACDVAEFNVESHGLSSRIRVVCGDLFGPLEENRRYDVIVSNPPYVSEPEYPLLSPEVRCEPKIALVSGKEGTDTIRRIVFGASRFLKNKGHLLIEMDPRQTETALEYGMNALGVKGKIIRDLAGLERVVVWSL